MAEGELAKRTFCGIGPRIPACPISIGWRRALPLKTSVLIWYANCGAGKHLTGKSRPRPCYDNWTDVFRALRRVVGQRRVIIILDEFPWAVDSDPSLPSYLQAAWDSIFRDSQICLFISGSHIHAMKSLIEVGCPVIWPDDGKIVCPEFSVP